MNTCKLLEEKNSHIIPLYYQQQAQKQQQQQQQQQLKWRDGGEGMVNVEPLLEKKSFEGKCYYLISL